MPPLNLDEVRKFAENMEFEAERFYRRAADTTRDASTRQLLLELAEIESQHEDIAHKLEQTILTPTARAKEDETARRMFLLQYVQPGLAGLMDGSVSTLAPLFAAAFATHSTWETFLVGHGGVGRRRHLDGLRGSRCPTTARSPGAARRGCAARSAG